MTKPLPTLWVPGLAARLIDTAPGGMRTKIYGADRANTVPYIPASSLAALEAENAALRALLVRAFSFTCHDHYVGPCATEERPEAACTCGFDDLVCDAKPYRDAALTPTKQPPPRGEHE